MFTIEMLFGNEGDALWIEYGTDEVHRILIDCGKKSAYRQVRSRLKAAAEAGQELNFELFVLTHVDADHVQGAVPLLGDELFKPKNVADIWFNGWRHHLGERVPPSDHLGARQGEYFAALLRDRSFPWNTMFDYFPVIVPEDGPLPSVTLPGDMTLTLLSPTTDRLEAMKEEWEDQLGEKPPGDAKHIPPGDFEKALEVLSGDKTHQPDALGARNWVKDWNPDDFDNYAAAGFSEDTKAPNGASIAFLAEHDGKAVLFTGDAYPSVLRAGLKRLKEERGLTGRLDLNAFKLPHHGSQNNISTELIQDVSCKHWLVSTNGSGHHHPHPSAIARVIEGVSGKPKLYFNVPSDENLVWDDEDLREERGYKTEYGVEKVGLRVEL